MDAMKYVIFKAILIEALRKKWQDTKMSKLEYYITNANPQYRIKMRERIHRTTPMILGSRRAFPYTN